MCIRDSANGLAQREHVDAIAFRWHQHAGHARALATEVAEDVDGAADFAFRLGECLAFLTGHVGGHGIEFPVEDIGRFIENIAAPRAAHR